MYMSHNFKLNPIKVDGVSLYGICHLEATIIQDTGIQSHTRAELLIISMCHQFLPLEHIK